MNDFLALLSLHFQLAVGIAFQKLSKLFRHQRRYFSKFFTDFEAMDRMFHILLLPCELVVDVVS